MTLKSSQHAAVWRAQIWLTAAAAALLAQGCSAVPGEGESSCRAQVDADGDGVSGCKDSDCHRFELCRLSSDLGRPDGGTGGSSGAGGSGGAVGPTGGTGGVVPSSGGSGGSDELDDGGAEPDASSCSCSPDEMCSDGGCIPLPPPAPRYVIALHSADSPIGLPGPPPHGLCVEIACREPGAGSPVGFCPCEPEPYVRVVHISSPELDPIETPVLTTKVQGTSLSVEFDETERVEVPLQAGDALRFELWDDNVTTDDSLIYSCDPALGALVAGPLECSVLSGALASDEHWIRGELIVE